MHLKRDEPLSDVAFKFNVRRYTSVHHYGWYVEDMAGSQDDSQDDQETDQPPLRVKVYSVSTLAHWFQTHTHTRL